MKKRKLYHFFAAALALACVGCSNDDLLPEGGENSGSGGITNSKDLVYMNVTVQLPTGRNPRSTTGTTGGSSDGTEIGLDRENKVNSVLLVLAKKDNNAFIACAEKLESLATEANGKITTVQSISKTVLSAYYGTDGTLTGDEQEINVFVFCNPTGALRGIFENLPYEDTSWFDKSCSITENSNGESDNGTIWGGPDHQGGFLMSSSAITTKKLPANFSDWNDFTSVDNPFKLSGKNSIIGGSSDAGIDNGNAINVERSVARFDFKDGSAGNNTYDVVKDPNDETRYIMQIQLQKMALVNMSKSFYFLRRVSDNGLNDGANLCGVETSSNYVVDADAADKNSGKINGTDKKYSDHFNFCLGNSTSEWTIDATARGQWFTSKISDVTNGDKDNDEWGNETTGDYRIWRYVTENTIPGEISNQATGLSTGIVFTGKMQVPEGVTGSLADAINNAKGDSDNDAILYVYGTDILVTWKEVRAMAIDQGKGSPMYTAVFGTTTEEPVAEKAASEGSEAVEAVYSTDTESADYKWNAWHNVEGDKDATKFKEFKKAATGNGFTIYESSLDPDFGAGYYCYYFYWNRHNDNGNNGVMGPMEFGVVRNNVYKLAVNSIRKLGHPRLSENDPDPVNPDDPDEKGDIYLSVSVDVLPWVVRVNGIDF